MTERLDEGRSLTLGRAEDADVRITDPLASRYHARLSARGGRYELEDLGSANGTLLRDEPVPVKEPRELRCGDAIRIGSTILLLQAVDGGTLATRVRSHGFFEARLVEECESGTRARMTFVVARVDVEGGDAAPDAIIAEHAGASALLAECGPDEFEILFPDCTREHAQAALTRAACAFAKAGGTWRFGLASFPDDGRSPAALLAHASGQVRRGEELRRDGVLVRSGRMREIYQRAERVAGGHINVLILGETGAGKELLARHVHATSPRRTGRFLCLNCAALTESLLESELFGHEQGAFTGAGARPKQGLLEAASGGTVFLDEVGEMAPSFQAKLLRAIETRQFIRVGGTVQRSADVRFVAATNRDLQQDVATGRFRKDLYFRLAGITLGIPPLRERSEEIGLLARLFMDEAASNLGRPAPALSRSALDALKRHAWPGNIRELRNVVERAVLLCVGSVVTPEDLALGDGVALGREQPRPSEPSVRERKPLPSRAEFERAYHEVKGSVHALARRFSRDRRQIYRWVQSYGLGTSDDGGDGAPLT
jgi:DNA-binding NtrC family response regulator